MVSENCSLCSAEMPFFYRLRICKVPKQKIFIWSISHTRVKTPRLTSSPWAHSYNSLCCPCEVPFSKKIATRAMRQASLPKNILQHCPSSASLLPTSSSASMLDILQGPKLPAKHLLHPQTPGDGHIQPLGINLRGSFCSQEIHLLSYFTPPG